jgi:hypothetical protein
MWENMRNVFVMWNKTSDCCRILTREKDFILLKIGGSSRFNFK